MKVRSQIQITLEIPIEGTWDDSCTLSQVRKQSLELAKDKLHLLFRDEGVTICGTIKAALTIVENE